MLRQNLHTGRVKKNVRIKKGSIIDFFHANERSIEIRVRHKECSYYWLRLLDEKTTIQVDFSYYICSKMAHLMSQVAGFTGVKLVREEGNILSFKVI